MRKPELLSHFRLPARPQKLLTRRLAVVLPSIPEVVDKADLSTATSSASNLFKSTYSTFRPVQEPAIQRPPLTSIFQMFASIPQSVST
jgi:hypothetical protein